MTLLHTLKKATAEMFIKLKHGTEKFDPFEAESYVLPPHAVSHESDSYTLTAMSHDGFVIHIGCQLRGDEKHITYGSLYVPDGRMYHSHQKTDQREGRQCGGFNADLVIHEEKWRFSFDGSMMCDNKEHYIRIDCEFNANGDIVEPLVNPIEDVTSDVVADESWDSDLSDYIEKDWHTWYSQWGRVTADININGEEVLQVNMQGVREHSFGALSMSMFDRWMKLYAYCEDELLLTYYALDHNFVKTVGSGVVFTPTGKSNIENGFTFDELCKNDTVCGEFNGTLDMENAPVTISMFRNQWRNWEGIDKKFTDLVGTISIEKENGVFFCQVMRDIE